MVGRFGARSRVRAGERGEGRRRHAGAALLRPRDWPRDLRRNRRKERLHEVQAAWALLFARSRARAVGDRADGGGGRRRRRWRRHETAAAEDVSGRSRSVAVWTGAEAKAFQAVLDGFKEQYPNVDVKYKRREGSRPGALDRGRGRQPARRRGAHRPGLMRDFVDQRRAQAARLRAGHGRRRTSPRTGSSSATSTASSTASSSRAPTSRPSGTTSTPSRTPASSRRRPGRTSHRRETLKASGVPAYSFGGVGRLDAHRPVREPLPAQAGPRSTTSSPSTRSRGPTSRSRTR